MARLFDDAATEHLDNSNAPVASYPLSMGGWFNTDDLINGQTLISIAQAARGDEYFALVLGVNIAGDFLDASVRSQVAGAQHARTTVGIQANTWHHGLGVFTSATSRASYIDGGGKGVDAVNCTPVSVDRMSIARICDISPSFYMSGGIGEVFIYNCPLTDTDAALLFYRRWSPLKVRPQNLVAYWVLRGGDNADWMGRYPVLPVNTPSDVALLPDIVYPEPDDPVWGLVLPRYRPKRRIWVLTSATSKSLAGSLTMAGALGLKTSVGVAGSLTPTGAQARKPTSTASGILIPAGSLDRKISVALSGSMTPTGALATSVSGVSARTKITRHDIRLDCPGIDSLALSGRYIPYCGGSVPGVDDVEEALDYLMGYVHGLALNSWNEVPSGVMDGSNLLYTTSFAYEPDSLRVYWNGLHVKPGLDYVDGPGGDEFTMNFAPRAADDLLVDYKR